MSIARLGKTNPSAANENLNEYMTVHEEGGDLWAVRSEIYSLIPTEQWMVDPASTLLCTLKHVNTFKGSVDAHNRAMRNCMGDTEKMFQTQRSRLQHAMTMNCNMPDGHARRLASAWPTSTLNIACNSLERLYTLAWPQHWVMHVMDEQYVEAACEGTDYENTAARLQHWRDLRAHVTPLRPTLTDADKKTQKANQRKDKKIAEQLLKQQKKEDAKKAPPRLSDPQKARSTAAPDKKRKAPNGVGTQSHIERERLPDYRPTNLGEFHAQIRIMLPYVDAYPCTDPGDADEEDKEDLGDFWDALISQEECDRLIEFNTYDSTLTQLPERTRATHGTFPVALQTVQDAWLALTRETLLKIDSEPKPLPPTTEGMGPASSLLMDLVRYGNSLSRNCPLAIRPDRNARRDNAKKKRKKSKTTGGSTTGTASRASGAMRRKTRVTATTGMGKELCTDMHELDEDEDDDEDDGDGDDCRGGIRGGRSGRSSPRTRHDSSHHGRD